MMCHRQKAYVVAFLLALPFFAAFRIAPVMAAAEVSCIGGASGRECGPRVLPEITSKAAILQFIDQSGAELGETVSRLFWRETLNAISDMRGRGVILATGLDRQPEMMRRFGGNPLEMLRGGYHGAALKISDVLGTSMAAWGGVATEADAILLYAFLSMTPEHPSNALVVTLGPSQVRPDTLPVAQLQLRFDRLAFPPQEARPAHLFRGPILLRCNLDAGCPQGVPVFRGPGEDTLRIRGLAEGTSVTVIEARGKWLQLRLPDDRVGWTNIYHLDFAPIAVSAPVSVRPSSSPGASPSSSLISFSQPRPVLEMRRVGNRRWYRIMVEGERSGWISDAQVEPFHRIPGVHMLAGIYRLGAGQNERAEREFRAFLDSADPDTDGTSERLTVSAALQLIALARARKIIASGIKAERHSEVEEPLGKAALLTPFDPGLWALRAALLLMIDPDRPERAFEALRRALTLDPDQPDVRAFSDALAIAVVHRPQQLARMGLLAERVATLVALLPQPGTPPR
ncbi:MAG: hypothetical protein ACK5WN_06345 [Alphaproteobacteria bacterium]|jgi:SH3-like domain-containing protein